MKEKEKKNEEEKNVEKQSQEEEEIRKMNEERRKSICEDEKEVEQDR